jgi:hypothetical protein
MALVYKPPPRVAVLTFFWLMPPFAISPPLREGICLARATLGAYKPVNTVLRFNTERFAHRPFDRFRNACDL